MIGLSIRSLAATLLGTVLLVLSPRVLAQEDLSPPTVTTTYALDDVRVVQAPGQVIESATVVVEDGLIEAVGTNVEIPYDARRIEGDSLVVYAGFIDGFSHAGIEQPESDDEDDVEDPGSPPPDQAGIQPDRSARSLLSPDESTLEDLRKVGFTAGHVTPEGQMLPGTGAYVLFGGASPDEMILEADPTLSAQIEGSSNYVYPATNMAVIAKMRQLFREADRRQELEAAYSETESGQRRPPRDPIHSAFFPVLDGEMPLAFYADDVLSIHRVLNLQAELDFPLLLAGLGESFRTLDELQSTDAPLFLTLDLPDAADRAADNDTTVADTTDQPERHYDPHLQTRSFQDVQTEETNLRLRHAMEREKYRAAAAEVHEAGLTFGFSTRNADPGDVRENLRTMIDHGLPEEVALASLTTHPASLLGLSNQLGSVEEGKIANLVVTDGPYFDEDVEVQHVFVDGELHDYSSDAEEGEITGDVSAVVGTWSYTLESPQGDRTGTLTIEGDESGLVGSISSSEGDEQEIESISFDGTTLSFSIPTSRGPTLSVSVTVEENAFEGTVSTPGGSFPITGERESSPNR